MHGILKRLGVGEKMVPGKENGSCDVKGITQGDNIGLYWNNENEYGNYYVGVDREIIGVHAISYRYITPIT